jgi:hypothetical protein
MKTLIVRLIGLAAFLGAFAAPAVKSLESAPAGGIYFGWTCALVAISTSAGIPHLFTSGAWRDKDVIGAICLVLSGWVNPLVLIYLVCSAWKSLVRTRRVLACAILACIGATWAFLAKAQMTPLVGHFLWIGGILSMLSPEVFALFRKASATE